MDSNTREVVSGLEADLSQVQQAVFDKYYARVVQFVRSGLNARFARRVDPSDVAMSAFRSFFIRAREGQFKIEESNQLWKLLVTITLNKLRNKARDHNAAKRAVDREANDLPVRMQSNALGPEDVAILNDELEFLLQGLKPFHREIGERILMGLPGAQIAAATQRSLRTVRRVEANLENLLVARFRQLENSNSHGS